MSDLLGSVLDLIEKNNVTDSLQISLILNVDHQKVVGVVKSLQANDGFVDVEQTVNKSWELTEEGQSMLITGSYEVSIFNMVSDAGTVPYDIIVKQFPNATIGFSKAMAKGWISFDRNTKMVTPKVPSVIDEVQHHLLAVSTFNSDSIPDKIKAEYKKRKLIQEVAITNFIIRKGPKFSRVVENLETELTPEMIATGSWRDVKFKPYNFEAAGQDVPGGSLHPLLKMRTEFRRIFLDMGFTEMPTNNYVENSFWNFDALFQPQQHPARDAHDTFFLDDPRISLDMPPDYVHRVKVMHSVGSNGSAGYQYEWSNHEAVKNVLRTHTTAVSARMLYQLAQNEFKPVKYFSIDRVFRNETLDATHLAEFHQVEGVIADNNLTLGNLIGILHEFFEKLGFKKLKFKPAYNPYTEPSMEIFCYHEGLRKWIEIGNSGMFRPEMLLPMGLPHKVNVIAWGLSLERPTMIKYGINNIRDLVGPKIDLQIVSDSPICRFNSMS